MRRRIGDDLYEWLDYAIERQERTDDSTHLLQRENES